MTSRSLEPGQSTRTGLTEPVLPIPKPERIGLPGQPEGKSNGRSRPADVLTAVQLRAHADELGFSPQDQVRWLAPVQLVRTGIQVLLATAFSTFNDKRELQRSFPTDPLVLAADQDGGSWVDFMADTGDGFDSTFTVASLLAAPELTATAPDGARYQLPRGRLLILGGDEVYPTASSERYEDRLKGPMRTALHTDDVTQGTAPLLLALPGNHDWYDGLTAFLRVFGQRRRIGGWQTVQGRSYFVMQLPNGWWLAGLDSQLGSEIDDPQLDFFREQLSLRLQPGDGVILCCATPTWTHTVFDARAFDSFDYFERKIVNEVFDPQTGETRSTGAQIRLWITGDSHHYARYAEALEAKNTPADDPPTPVPAATLAGESAGRERQLITSGLGGAYLAATHRLPADLTLPPAGSPERHHGEPASYRLATRWPSQQDSRRMVNGMMSLSGRGLPFRNPGFFHLASAVHALLFLLLIQLLGIVQQQGPVEAVRSVQVDDVWRLGGQLALWWLVAGVIYTAITSYRSRRFRGPSLVLGGVGLQLAVALIALVVTVWVVRAVTLPGWFPGGKALPNFLLLVVMVAVVAPVAGLIGSYAVALTLALSRSRLVSDWQFSAQSIDDHKGFVRIRIEPDGRLVLYPLVVDAVPRRWRIAAGAAADRPPARVTAADGLPQPYLIEAPVVILRSSGAS